MVKAITFGYRWEGLSLHQWAFTHTELLAVVLPGNRLSFEDKSGMVKDWAAWFRIPLLCQMSQDSREFVDQLKGYNPDIILCHCYTYRLIDDILALPPLGCINIHPGKLPRYRGMSPIETAFNKGETILWVSLHFMDAGFDTGPVIATAPVDRKGDLEEMRGELTKAGLQLLETKWENIITKKL